ncbi:hypothetical protein [Abyssalbus ytuae]|uniref:Lipoprotein n=1 Tax=Abyssalbus ytuae TaxID=2926907 RepID=A0A9E6ZNK6_9FLAO|nr:hypothetical protein [Abyssalbus ytuae]UOB18004.1 hypothetical protein MQE35_01590 [Abyssalbus ytuae]
MSHKIIYSLLLTVVLSACNSNTNKKEETDKTDTEIIAEENPKAVQESPQKIDNVEAIKKGYMSITDKIATSELKQTSFEFDCAGEQVGKVTYYWDGNELKMIEKIYGEYSHRNATEQYYISNGKPYFIYTKITDWSFDSDSGKEGATKDNVQEYRYYIIDEKLVKCLKKEYTIRSAALENPDPNTINNATINCPGNEELLEPFKKLFNYREQSAKIQCL